MDSSLVLKKIVKRVLLAHAALLLFLVLGIPFAKKKTIEAPKILKENFRTIQPLQPPKVVTHKKKPPQKTSPVKRVAKPVKAPLKTKKIAKAPQKNPPVKRVTKPLEGSEKIQKIAKVPELTKTAPLVVPAPLKKLQIEEEDKEFTQKEPIEENRTPYQSLLREIIEAEFEVAAREVVCIDLTLKNNGNVIKCTHKSSSDAVSRDHIISSIEKKQFPSFFGEVAHHNEFTFVLELEGTEL